ncbi:ribosomal protein [Nucleospora cyclopteri]
MFVTLIGRKIDLNIIIQSFVPLSFNMLSLYLIGCLFDFISTDDNLKQYPLILQSTCLMSFKGNIEVIFAVQIALLREQHGNFKKYISLAFNNTNLLMLQSFVIGLFIGLLGTAYHGINNGWKYDVGVRIMISTMFSCIMTTFFFIVLLFCVVELVRWLEIDEENFIMPSFSSAIDYFNARFLVICINFFNHISSDTALVFGSAMIVIATINLCFSFSSTSFFPSISPSVLLISLLASMFGGSLIQKFSQKTLFLAVCYPFFCGMSVSITLIFLHRIFTNIEIPTKPVLINTLIFISLVISLIYSLINSFMIESMSLLFPVTFVCMFIVQTYILLMILDNTTLRLKATVKNIELYSLPLISNISDILTIFSLIIACKTAEFFEFK